MSHFLRMLLLGVGAPVLVLLVGIEALSQTSQQLEISYSEAPVHAGAAAIECYSGGTIMLIDSLATEIEYTSGLWRFVDSMGEVRMTSAQCIVTGGQ